MIATGPPRSKRDVVRRQAAREDRDDRERDGEVLEPAHPAEELLRVAQLVEDLLVLRGVVPAAFGLLCSFDASFVRSGPTVGGYSRPFVPFLSSGDTTGTANGRRIGADAELRGAAQPGRAGRGRHGRRRVHRHAGAPDRKAPARGVLRRGGRRRPSGRGLQLPARARDGDGPRSRLRDRELGARVRRLRAPARPRDAAADPVARGDGARPLRRRLAGRQPGRTLAAPGPARPAGARRRARLHADGRLRARVLPAPGDLRRGAREALPRPDALGAVHPRLPHPRHHLRRAAAPTDPERDARRPGSGSRPRRAKPGPASRRSTSASPTR